MFVIIGSGENTDEFVSLLNWDRIGVVGPAAMIVNSFARHA